jgi:alanine racemase
VSRVMENYRQTYAEINLENLLHNWSVVRSIAGDDRFICPMVKANAYGHGSYEVASVLERESAKCFGVCLIEEGLALREAGLKSDLLVFGGFDKQGAEKSLEYQLTPVIGSWEQLKAIESLADSTVKIHIKFETGMNRLGFSSDEAEKVSDYLKKSKNLKLKAILTHLACGEDAGKNNGMTERQLKSLSDLKIFFSSFDIFAHALNSGGILGFKESSNDSLVKKEKWGFRPGLMLYGYQPPGLSQKADLKPVMSFRSSVHLQRRVKENETVSYGATWKAARPSHIAVIPAGYADGIKRQLSNKGHVIIHGHRLPIIGIVCMDFFMVDLTELVNQTGKENWLHEEVLLFGEDSLGHELSANEWAEKTNSISWEILTSVSERVPRHYKGLTQS